MNISKIRGHLAAGMLSLLMLAAPAPDASAQGVAGENIIILLRVTGDSRALVQLRSCLSSRLSQMPDVEIATTPTDGERFIVDIIVAKGADHGISTSLVMAETFPIEQFRPRLKQGVDADALFAAMRFYTLLRLHEVVPGRSAQDVCTRIIADISDKVLSKEYTARDD